MPIIGKPNNLTAQDILKKITEYDIYKYYTPTPFKLGRTFNSPLRKDNNPSFVIKTSKESGYIYHMDFVYEDHTGNSFQYVQQMFTNEDGSHLSYRQALEKINNDFGLGLGSNPIIKDYKSITNKYEQPSELKPPPFITITTRNFTNEEARYWNSYNISTDDCKKYDIFPIDNLYVDGTRYTNPMNRLRFAYRYEVYLKELWKIYTPLIKKECGLKWYTNVPIDTMEGLELLSPGANNIITKSRKDLVITRKFIPTSCAAQNESPVAINQENINWMNDYGIIPHIFFDNDDPGVMASKFYTDTYNFKYLNIPRKFLDLRGIKDISDLSKTFGLKKCEEFFKIKGLI